MTMTHDDTNITNDKNFKPYMHFKDWNAEGRGGMLKMNKRRQQETRKARKSLKKCQEAQSVPVVHQLDRVLAAVASHSPAVPSTLPCRDTGEGTHRQLLSNKQLGQFLPPQTLTLHSKCRALAALEAMFSVVKASAALEASSLRSCHSTSTPPNVEDQCYWWIENRRVDHQGPSGSVQPLDGPPAPGSASCHGYLQYPRSDSRVLPRIASRLSNSKLAFNPYSMAQLKSIVGGRLTGMDIIADAAIDLAVRKVGRSSTGDVRRVLESCAAPLIWQENDLRKWEEDSKPPQTARASHAGLGSKRLLAPDPGWRHIKMKVSFNVTVDDVLWWRLKEDLAWPRSTSIGGLLGQRSSLAHINLRWMRYGGA
eukprot:gene11218-18841_t